MNVLEALRPFSFIVVMLVLWLLHEILHGESRFKPKEVYLSKVNKLTVEESDQRNFKAKLSAAKRVFTQIMLGVVILLIPVPKEYWNYVGYASLFFLLMGSFSLFWYMLLFTDTLTNYKWFNATFDEKGNFRK